MKITLEQLQKEHKPGCQKCNDHLNALAYLIEVKNNKIIELCRYNLIRHIKTHNKQEE